jgi:hypothetical protein
MSPYNNYANMTSNVNDQSVDGEDFEGKIKEYNLSYGCNEAVRTPKRHHSGEQRTTVVA